MSERERAEREERERRALLMLAQQIEDEQYGLRPGGGRGGD